jgi:hypothetical protein
MKRTLTLVVLIGAALLVAAVAGCGGTSTKKTSLELVADNGSFGSKAVFHLSCDPPGGDISRPARACAALKKNSQALLHPTPFQCLMESWNISISGRFEGRPVNVKTETCWTPQMELIDRLGIANQLVTHFVSFGVPRDQLAKVVDIPANAPVWLIAMAESQAVSLQDVRPDRMRIRLGSVDVVELWGHFSCGKSCFVSFHGPARKVLTGTYARIKVDPAKRVVVGFWLKPAAS